MPQDARLKGYTEMGFFVKLIVPEFRSLRDVERDLRSCLSFGSPEVTSLYEAPARRPETDVSVADERL